MAPEMTFLTDQTSAQWGWRPGRSGEPMRLVVADGNTANTNVTFIPPLGWVSYFGLDLARPDETPAPPARPPSRFRAIEFDE